MSQDNLVKCRECEHPVARSAKSCPNCGADKPSLGRGGLVSDLNHAAPAFFGLLIVIAIVYVLAKIGCGI